MIRLTEWCKHNGISYTTAWRLRRDGKFPHPTRNIGRTVFVVEDGDEQPATLVCPHCHGEISVEVLAR